MQQTQELLIEEEKECTRMNIAKSLYDHECLPREVCVQPVPQCHSEPKHKPKIWMGTKVLKNQTTQSDPILDKDYCVFATPLEEYALKCVTHFPQIWTVRS